MKNSRWSGRSAGCSLLLLVSLAACGEREIPSDEVRREMRGEPEATSVSRGEDGTDAELKEMLVELGEGYRGAVEGPFLVVGNLSSARLDRFITGTIRSCMDRMNRQYFDDKPEERLKIYLFSGEKVYRAMARKLWGDENVSYYGYYSPANRALVMNIDTGGGTLVHEMFHALVEPDFPDIPAWFNEGVASLYEACRIGEKGLTGLMNWRFPRLKTAVEEGEVVPLRDLVAMTTREFYGPASGLHYAEARYFCMYLQEQGLLEEYYRLFRDSVGRDSSGREQLEELLEKEIDGIEAAWLAWVKTLEYEG